MADMSFLISELNRATLEIGILGGYDHKSVVADYKLRRTEMLQSDTVSVKSTRTSGDTITAKQYKIAKHKFSGVMTESGTLSTPSMSELADALRQSYQNETTNAILLTLSTGGGTSTAAGILSEAIDEANDYNKLIIVHTPYLASAGIYASVGAHLVVANDPIVNIGSVGVMQEYSKKIIDQMRGDWLPIISKTSPRKLEELTSLIFDNNDEMIQDSIMKIDSIFKTRVKSKRLDIASTTVNDAAMEGQMFTAREAEAAGLIDGIATERELIYKVIPKMLDEIYN